MAADVAVVLDNVLCFLVARYGKTAINRLKVARRYLCYSDLSR